MNQCNNEDKGHVLLFYHDRLIETISYYGPCELSETIHSAGGSPRCSYQEWEAVEIQQGGFGNMLTQYFSVQLIKLIRCWILWYMTCIGIHDPENSFAIA